MANYLTKDERTILSYLGAFLIAGMALHYTGVSVMHAEKAEQNKQVLTEAVAKDTLILIDIRTAGAEELELLPGVGAKKTKDILDYRSVKQFDSPEELLNIKGIGPKTYIKMKPMLLSFGTSGAGVTEKQKLQDINVSEVFKNEGSEVVQKQELDGTDNISKKEHSEMKYDSEDTESTIHLNTASRDELISLSGIGEKKADAIIAYRKEIGKFTSIKQLLDVKGIGAKTLEKNRHRLSL